MKTDITIILDRSGSMMSMRNEAQASLNTFIKEQKENKEEATFTLVQFDDKYDIVHDGIDLQKVPKITLEPRGLTALLDAIGKTVNHTKERLELKGKIDQPDKVIIVIITDGMENASKEFRNADDIKKLVIARQDEDKWQFIFLGTSIEGFDVHATGLSYGFNPNMISAYAHSGDGYTRMVGSLSQSVTAFRAGDELKIDAEE
jgi:uncharacterized protein YegL